MSDESTSSTVSTAASLDPVDAIANLLIEDESPKPETKPDEGAVGKEQEGTPAGEPDGSTGEGDKESGKEDEGQGEVTWSSVLGVDDTQIDLDEEGNLKGLVVKIDGVTSTVPVKELVADYQLRKFVTQKSQALSEERKEFESIRKQAVETYVEKLQTAEKLTQVLQKNLLKEYEAIDWNQLRATNPGEYAATMTDFQNRQAQLAQIMDSIAAETKTQQEVMTQEQQQHYHEWLKGQYERVIERNPEWREPEKFKAAMIDLGQAAQTHYEITPEEFASLNDSRYLEILRDAVAFRKGKTAVEKKVVNVPRFQKAGGKQTKPMDKLTQLTLNARKATGAKQRDLQAAAIAELLMGNKAI